MQEVRDILNKFAKTVVTQSKRNLTTKGKGGGALHKSISYDLEVGPNSFSLDFIMEEYGNYVDKGVKGAKRSAKAPRSPFKFGSGRGKKGGLTKGIDKWVRKKGIQFRDRKTGRFLSYDGTAYIIRRSIWNTGIKPSMFFTKPFEKHFEKLPQELKKKFALDVEDFINHKLKEFKK